MNSKISVSKFTPSFQIHMFRNLFCEFFVSFFLGLSTKYDINNHIEFWFLFSNQ